MTELNDQMVGAAVRAVRIKRGWRQTDVANRARVAASVVSLIERGHIDGVSIRAFRRVTDALEIRSSITLRMAHGELERILNAGHAALHESMARYLGALPDWVSAPEVSFSIYGERGVIDVLAFHEPTRSLLVIELKTEFVSLEDLLSTMDIRIRHALQIARERGWHAKTVSAWVVFHDSDMNRDRVNRHRAVLRTAFPVNGNGMRRWLSHPSGPIRALSFWGNSGQGTANACAATRRRVRVQKRRRESAPTRADM